MKKDDPKFRELLEKIDPTFRLARLNVEMEGGEPDGQGGVTVGLRQRFVEALSQAQAQSRLVALHQEQVPLADAEAQAVQVLRIKQAAENERIAWLMVEHFGNEFARLAEQIDSFGKAGLPKEGAEEEPTPIR